MQQLNNDTFRHHTMIKDILAKFGLSQKEVETYLTSLRYGTQPSSIISKKVNLPKTSTREILEKLVKKRFMTKSIKQNTNLYSPNHPQVIIEMLEKDKENDLLEFNQNIENFKKLSPHIENMLHANSSVPKIRMYEGLNGIKNLYHEVLNSYQDIDSIEDNGDIYTKFIPDFADYFIEERVKRKMKNRCIFSLTKDSIGRNYSSKELLRETKGIPSHIYPFCCDIKIFGDSVSFVMFEESTSSTGIIITHPKIANNFRYIFKFMWDSIK